ncbi:MAG: hypothetical protein WCX28_01270 [Bacteriovoracaceae bacterium]|nr:hypothetical protein [Bacteroidota bacterium]
MRFFSVQTDSFHQLLTFRDYSTELTGNSRFIPVKSDASQILTCILEYSSETVTVTDQKMTHEITEYLAHAHGRLDQCLQQVLQTDGMIDMKS